MTAPRCVEIGRYHGGSTTLLLAAGAHILSIDNHCKDGKNGLEYDKKLIKWAKEQGLRVNLKIAVENSTTYNTDGLNLDVLFIDGAHSYEGVRDDLDNWIKVLKPNGHLFMHDLIIPGVKQAYDEKAYLFKFKKQVASLLHARKL